jgi:hypothetical protein
MIHPNHVPVPQRRYQGSRKKTLCSPLPYTKKNEPSDRYQSNPDGRFSTRLHRLNRNQARGWSPIIVCLVDAYPPATLVADSCQHGRARRGLQGEPPAARRGRELIQPAPKAASFWDP